MKQAAFVTACIALTAAAHAGPVDLTYDGVGSGVNVTIATQGGINSSVFAGSIRHLVDGELTMTYCIDPEQWAQGGTAEFQRTTLPLGIQHRNGWEHKSTAIASVADSLGSSLWSTSVDQNVAAAFQLTVWEILKDFDAEASSSGLDLSSGAFSATADNSVIALAQGYLSSIDINARNVGTEYVAYTNENHQDMMSNTVPSPASLALTAIAAPMLIRRRRE